MSELIDKLKSMPFVNGISESYDEEESPKKHVTIKIKKSLIKEKKSLPKLFDLLTSQSFFEWTVDLDD